MREFLIRLFHFAGEHPDHSLTWLGVGGDNAVTAVLLMDCGVPPREAMQAASVATPLRTDSTIYFEGGGDFPLGLMKHHRVLR